MTPRRGGAPQRPSHLAQATQRLIAVLAALGTSHAGASGTLKTPETRETLRSAGACLAFLRARAGEDARKASRETIALDGSRRAVSVEVKVPLSRRSAPDEARYVARIWYTIGWPLPDGAMVKYRTSWEEHSYECRGRNLITRTSQGFAGELFEPQSSATP